MLSSMAVACDRSHEHAPWKEGAAFRTGEEAEYPEEFCRHVAKKFRAPLGRKRKAEHQHTTTEEWKAAAKQPKNNKEEVKATVGSQPRAGRVTGLIPEFKEIVVFRVSAAEAARCEEALSKNWRKGWLDKELSLQSGRLEKGWRVLEVTEEGGDSKKVRAGVPWTPGEFTEQACAVSHPFSRQAAAPDRSLKAIFDVLTLGPEGIREKRRKTLAYWGKRAAELDDYERELYAKAPEQVRACWARRPDHQEALTGKWKGKRTELLREMALEAKVPSTNMVIEMLRGGAPPFGEIPRTGAFSEKPHPATKSFEDILKGAKWAKPVLRATVKPHKDKRIDDEVLARTQE